MIPIQGGQPTTLFDFLIRDIPFSLVRYLIPHPDFIPSKQGWANQSSEEDFSRLQIFTFDIFPKKAWREEPFDCPLYKLLSKIDLLFYKFFTIFFVIPDLISHIQKPLSALEKTNIRNRAHLFFIRKCFNNTKNLHLVRKILLIPNLLINNKICEIYFAHLAYPVMKFQYITIHV